MMTANEVRESFKKFFEGKGHKIVPSAPMVIKDDPTLMFTNAGMNQWKDIILGTKDPGKDVRRVTPMVGAEQEYFLVDKKLWEQRRDLIYTGRTLFGAVPPKTQELDDHYYGTIQPRILAYMQELDEELWKLEKNKK